jgi:hypothetical protein
MVWIKEKNADDGYPSARLFDAETDHFDPTLSGSARFHLLVVEISLFAGSILRRFRLNPNKSGCCAVQFPIEARP